MKKSYYITAFLNYDKDEDKIQKPIKYPWINPTRSLFCLEENNRFRLFIKKVIQSRYFESFIMLNIFASCIALSMAKPFPNNDSNNLNSQLELTEPYFLAIFTIESLLKIILYGLILHPKSYLRNIWNILDFSIVLLGFVSIIASAVGQTKFDIKALRAFRVFRPLRLVSRLPSLQVVLNSVLIAMRPLANIGLLVGFFLIMFSVVGMELFSGIFHATCYNNVTNDIMPNPKPCSLGSFDTGYNCDNLPKLPADQQWICIDMINNNKVNRYPGPAYGINSFDHIGLALLTVFQVVTYEGWSNIMTWTINYYGNTWTWIYFIILILVGAFFMLNLIVGVLCGEFTKEKQKVERRNKYLSQKNKVKEMEDYVHYKKWIECGEKIAKLSNIDNTALPTKSSRLTNMNDEENEIAAKKLTLLDKIKKCKPYVMKCRLRLFTLIKSRIYFVVILGLVLINSAIVATKFTQSPPWLTSLQDYSNVTFMILFTVELVVKLFTLGFKAYFSKIFNIFDFIVVLSSVLEIIIAFTTPFDQIGFSILRSVRLLRVFKLTVYWDQLRGLVQNMIRSINSILSLMLLLLLFIIIMSLLGMQLFGGQFNYNPNHVIRSNFNDIFQAVITVFQLITTKFWNVIMFHGINALGGINSVGSLSAFYFVIVIIIGNYILLNVFFAIVLEILYSKQQDESSEEKVADIDSDSDGSQSTEHECEVPVAEELVVVQGFSLMPPNPEGNILSINPIVVRSRGRHAAPVHRVRIVFKPVDEETQGEDTIRKATYKELYGEEQEDDAININLQSSSKTPSVSRENADFQEEMEPIPIGTSFFIFTNNNKFRIFCHRVSTHSLKNKVVLVMIICSCLLVAFYNPFEDNYVKEFILKRIDEAFTIIFLLELLINVISYGVILHEGAYLRYAFNWVDSIVVLVGILDFFVDATLAGLKSLRVLRVLKALRSIKAAKELRFVIDSLLIALTNIWKTMIITILMLLIFSVIGVYKFKGTFYSCSDPTRRTKDSCMGSYISYTYDGLYTPTLLNRTWSNYPLNFDNVAHAMLTLFITSTYQGYTTLLYKSTDATSEGMGPFFNNNRFVFFYYVAFFIVIRFFMVNTFIGFVVLSYKESRQFTLKSDELNDNQKQCISFVLKARPQRQYIPTKWFRFRLWKIVNSDKFENFISVVIVLNILSMFTSFDQQPPDMLLGRKIFNGIFLLIFTVEAILKMLAFNIRNYFDDKMNVFDIIVIIGSVVDVVFAEIRVKTSAININVFRLFRALRLVKLLMKSKSIRSILWTFVKSFKIIPWIVLIILMIMFVYAIIGLQFFGRIGLNNPGSAINDDVNFQNLLHAFLALFRLLTGEEWQDIMISCIDPVKSQCNATASNKTSYCGSIFSYFYFSSFSWLTYYFAMNLFLAAIVDNFDYLTNDRSFLSPHHLDEFIDRWSEYDMDGKGRLRPVDVTNLLTRIDPPLGFGKMCSHNKALRKIMNLNMPVESDGTVLFHATLFALIRNNLKIKIPYSDKDPKTLDEYSDELYIIMRKLWPKTDPLLMETLLPANVGESVTVAKIHATILIQDYYRKLQRKRKCIELLKVIAKHNTFDQDENDVSKITSVVIGEEQDSVVSMVPPSALESESQGPYNKFTDTVWTHFQNMFVVSDDVE